MRARMLLMAVASLLVAPSQTLAQNCDLGAKTRSGISCASPINQGSSSQCTISLTNGGMGDCVGTWTFALGTFDPGTVATPTTSSSTLLSSCTFVGDVTLPQPISNKTKISSAYVCQGSGALRPNETLSMTGRVTPASSFTLTSFLAGFLIRFRSSAMLGTVSFDSYGSSIPILINQCRFIPSSPGAVPSGTPYNVVWAGPSTNDFEIQEATNPDFSDAVTSAVMTGSKQFQHSVTTPTTFYYRVRLTNCGGSPGSFGLTTQTVVLPQQAPSSKDFDIVVPVGTTSQVSQDVRFGGLTPGATFTVTTDKTFLTVTPTSGTVRSDGSVTVTVKGDPSNLPVGANTGTLSIVVTTPSGKGSPTPYDTKTVNTPVSVSLVTPVSQVAKSAPPADALIVPAVAHLEGAGARFQSDVRITNAGTGPVTYLLTFTPQNTDGTTSGRQTTITLQGDQTVALNDILRDFFGFALPTDSAGGVLEIRATTGSIATTFVSSRTYATSPDGTYGQFIPAVPLAKFLKAGGGSLILTQVSQSDAFRTNIGLVEGLGFAASGKLKVFNPTGQNLGEFPFSLRPFEYTQLNRFLETKGIALSDARIEAVVDSASAGVSTYASVVDNRTADPLLVSPIKSGSVSASRYVLPGMADLNNPNANFHSDIRLYNGGSSVVDATLTYYPQGNPSASTAKTVTLLPGEIKAYDNVLPTLFGLSSTGGSIVVTTASNTSLIVSGRTYSNDAKKGGTYGQFIPAVTPVEGIGAGEASLQVLQLEQSANFRSNIGLDELTGNAVSVQVAVILPDSKVSPSTMVDLQPNEFRQLNSVIASLNPGSTYNARVTVKVIGGTGRVTAYGSVVDNNTNDPTYVPAQK